MKPKESYWQASLVGRTVMMLSTAATTSTVAKVLRGLEQGCLQLGRGSLAAALVRVDWGASGWLAGSRLVQGLTLVGVALERTGKAGAKQLQTAWAASRVGQGVRLWQANQTRTARFWGGLMLGLAVGIIVLGRISGMLTSRRQVAAAGLIPLSLLLLTMPVNLPVWIKNSRLLQLAYSIANMGVGEEA